MASQRKGVDLYVASVLDLALHREFIQIAQTTQARDDALVVDLKDTTEIRDSGAALLLMLTRLTTGRNSGIHLINCSPDTKAILESRNMTEHFYISEESVGCSESLSR